MPKTKGKNLSSTFSKLKSLNKNDHKREEQNSGTGEEGASLNHR